MAPIVGDSSVNAATDMLADGSDAAWSITAAGGSFATIVIEIAGNAGSNTLGVYDAADSTKQVQLFGGAATDGSQAVLSIKLDGSVYVNFVDSGINFAGNAFGYYLGTATEGTFYSNTALNADSADHMRAYQGKNIDTVQIANLAPGLWTDNEYVLAWEDLKSSNADWDYNDMVLMVESVQPVPLPAAAVLFGSALVGLVGVARRRQGEAA